MKILDLRKQSDDVRNHTRKQAHSLFKRGKTQKETAPLFSVHSITVNRWNQQFLSEGKKGLKVKQRGIKSGQGPILSMEQGKEIQKMIIDKTPDQLKLPFVLWDRKASERVRDGILKRLEHRD